MLLNCCAVIIVFIFLFLVLNLCSLSYFISYSAYSLLNRFCISSEGFRKEHFVEWRYIYIEREGNSDLGCVWTESLTAMASKLLLLTVFLLDLIAFGLAVAAEQRRSTVSFLNCHFSLCHTRFSTFTPFEF